MNELIKQSSQEKSKITKKKSKSKYASILNDPNMIFVIARGIPCYAKINSYFVQKPLGPSADSDWDCYGYENLEYDIVDRYAKDADWITSKMSDQDWDKVDEQIRIAVHEQAELAKDSYYSTDYD